MNRLKLVVVGIFVSAFARSVLFTGSVRSQQQDGQLRPPPVDARSPVDGKTRRERFSHNGRLPPECSGQSRNGIPGDVHGTATEAPAGYDNLTNGYTIQGPDFDTLNEGNAVALRSHNDNRFTFEEFENVADGVGPVYNAQSCRECHQNVVTGGASQVTVQRTGRSANGQFYESMGGSLIHSRATYADLVEHVLDTDNTRTFRISPSTLGDGYIEAIANSTLLSIRDSQPANMRGLAIMVPILEGNGDARIGRFGWKSQHASLESFSVDAYLNELGITTPLLPEENTSSGFFVGFGSVYDPKPEPEDDGVDARAFAEFMRATKAPPRGPLTADVLAGEKLFRQVGCNVCHVTAVATALPGSIINGGSFTVPTALGGKIIHPYSDFLLHNIGTGDGVPIQPTPEYAATANQMRTAPLWGIRTRNRLMHDGLSFTLTEAILRHAGQAAPVTKSFNELALAQKNQLLTFLNSL